MTWSSRNVILAGSTRGVARQARQAWMCCSRLASGAIERFTREQSGNVAMMFGFAMIPMVAAVGVGLDSYRGMAARAQLQDAIDSAGLALAKLPPGSDAHEEALRFVKASLVGKGVAPQVIESVTLTVEADGTGYALTGSLDIGPTLTAVIAANNPDGTQKKITVGTGNGVAWSPSPVEVALALDMTGSMDERGRMPALKIAAKNFLTTLKDGAKPGQVRVSVVPFSDTVRVNQGLKDQPWIDKGQNPAAAEMFFNASGGNVNPNRFALFAQLGTSWRGCLEMRPQPYDVQDDPADPSNPSSLYVPYFAPDEPDLPKKSGSTKSFYENDYLTDDLPNDPDWRKAQGTIAKYSKSNWDAKKSAKTHTGDGPNEGCFKDKMPTIVPLADATDSSYGELSDAIDDMEPVGHTNIVFGAAMAWHMVSPNGPALAGAARKGKPYGPENPKVVIIFTDGLNRFNEPNTDPKEGTCQTGQAIENKNRSDYQAMGYAWMNRLRHRMFETAPYGCDIGNDAPPEMSRRHAMDDRLRILCSNMRQSQIRVFAISVHAYGSSIDMLEECAGPGQFYQVDDVDDLDPTFQAIARQIRQLRLTQ